MKNTVTTCSAVMIAAGLLFAPSGHAFDMGNVMNPSKWMGGNNDRDRYDDYYDRGYGYPGGPGYGGPGYAPGYYGGAPGYGYGAPAPGYGGTPGYGAAPGQPGVPAYGAPAATDNSADQIEHLQDRVRVLEEALRKQQTQTPATNPAWGNAQPGYSAPATPSGSQSGYQYR